MHLPAAIYAMVLGLALIASMIAGYGMARAECARPEPDAARRIALGDYPRRNAGI